MATRRLEELQREAIGARSRLSINRWDTMQFDVQSRMFQLNRLIGAHAGDEIHRHVIVAVIATLQTYFRGTIIAITDFGDVYKERAAERITEKVSMKDALTWFNEKSVTFGELVAHFSSCNSTTDIFSWMSALLDIDLGQALAVAISEYDQRNLTADPKLIVPDLNNLLADLGEAFRLRHILAHEAASGLRVDSDLCKKIWEAVQTLIKGLNAVLWSTVYKDLPLTQSEMTEHAYRDLHDARKELADVLRTARRLFLTRGNLIWFRKNHRTWMKVTDDWYQNTYTMLQGTMWPSVSAADRAEVIRSRVKQVSQWVRSQEPE